MARNPQCEDLHWEGMKNDQIRTIQCLPGDPPPSGSVDFKSFQNLRGIYKRKGRAWAPLRRCNDGTRPAHKASTVTEVQQDCIQPVGSFCHQYQIAPNSGPSALNCKKCIWTESLVSLSDRFNLHQFGMSVMMISSGLNLRLCSQ